MAMPTETQPKFDRPPLGGIAPTDPVQGAVGAAEQKTNTKLTPAAKNGMSESKSQGSLAGAAGAGLQNAKDMFKSLNPHPGNLFHVLYKDDEEKPKDLSMYKDKTPVVWGSVLLITYIALGCILYTSIAGWSFVDALYFTIVTLTTVGYGDVLPETNGEMILTVFFVFVGVGLIGAALGIVAGTLLDKTEALEHKLDETSKRLNAMQANLIASTLLIVLMLGIGTVAFAFLEDQPFVTAFYFSAVTVTTVGYGDYSFTTEGGRIFGVFYLILGTVIIAKSLSDIATIPLNRRTKRLQRLVLEQYGGELSLEELHELTAAGANPGFCTRNEFILLMLKKLNKITSKDIRDAVSQFDKLDSDGSGVLTQADVDRQRRIDQAKNDAAAATVVAGAFDDALEGQSRPKPKSNQVSPV